jgi:hypothetical protein
MPLVKLFDQLKKRWMKAKRSESDDDLDDDEAPPRKRLKTR